MGIVAMDREPIFWLGHLVGHLEDVVGETIARSFSKRHGRFTPLDCPASREFMRLVDDKQRILKVNEGRDAEHLFNFDSERREAWIVSRRVPQTGEPSQEESKDEWIERHFAYLREDLLRAVEQGLPECARALTRELVSLARSLQGSQFRAVISDPKTPEEVALRLLPPLSYKDLFALQTADNLPEAVEEQLIEVVMGPRKPNTVRLEEKEAREAAEQRELLERQRRFLEGVHSLDDGCPGGHHAGPMKKMCSRCGLLYAYELHACPKCGEFEASCYGPVLDE